jgi:PRTRC genetic system protein E
MFQALKQLADKAALSITITTEGEEMTVTVIPKPKEGETGALSVPIQLTGTPAELDAEFTTAIRGFTAARTTIAEQMAAAEAQLKAAAKEAEDARKAKTKQVTKPVASKPSAATSLADQMCGDDDEGCCGGGGCEGVVPPIKAEPAVAAVSSSPAVSGASSLESLFD